MDSSGGQVSDGTQVGVKGVYSEHIRGQLFTVDTIWNIGETGDMNATALSILLPDW